MREKQVVDFNLHNHLSLGISSCIIMDVITVWVSCALSGIHNNVLESHLQGCTH